MLLGVRHEAEEPESVTDDHAAVIDEPEGAHPVRERVQVREVRGVEANPGQRPDARGGRGHRERPAVAA